MFTKIDSRIWSDVNFKKISVNEKLLFIYMITCKHRNMLGLYPLPKLYVQADLDWDIERVDKGFSKLSQKGFITYDTDTDMVFIKNFLKYNPLENPNQVKGAVKALDMLPTSAINSDLVNYLKTVDKPFLKPLIEVLSKGLPKQEEEEEEEEEEVKEKEEQNPCDSSDTFKEIINLYEENGFGLINGGIKQDLIYLSDDYSEKWVLDAIKIAIESNARNLGYVRGILKRWKAEGKNNGGMNKNGKGKQGDKEDVYAGLGLSLEDLQ